ncbi:acetyltransferase [Flammeovirga sp. SJP92]|uniref:acetyltransferase n=1 Tax=Flammeovirga sp. SJP92 TaxID=1775430 RepID=UPI000788CB79|nr:acetyltransferase [Flammeovirga sp. SJP92]KXX68567.1 hypothetical protein AVL50_22670 [Flammeovirga sp. SJP92]
MEIANIFIYGASGHGKVVYDCAISSKINVQGFIDDDPLKQEFLGCKVYKSTEISKDWVIIVAIGSSQIRKRIVDSLDVNFGIIKHSSSILSSHTVIHGGTVFFHNTVVQSGSEIGEHCIINTSSIIDHDCQLGNYVHVAPNAVLCGGVKVGNSSWIGAGSTIIQGITIGNNCTIGAGSVVINNIPDNAVVVGNPGKIIKYNNE